MSSTNPEERIADTPFQGFATSHLPLYSGPRVTIRIGSTNRKYKLLKTLICKQSPYFAAAFEGGFREGEEQSITLTEIDDVVSIRSFELLVQWLYLGRVIFGKLTPTETITAAIEFVRIADMCGVTGMETLMAEHIRAIIIANPAPGPRGSDTNTYCLISKHIISAASLPEEHPAYLLDDNYRFQKETQEVPNFSADLLKAVKATLKSLAITYSSITVKDPVSGGNVYLGKN
ncbi:uncharacterized protein K441DRAFT_690398 [Cenococcum geophilum 1.58]|uniref:uncharacterized protein n=1 Tax=Cenococcum geophilum 1.58 TaxID=794803 RepID=UPI0035901DBA|nr:hypothetical protein K441DRAFT_690398 [Cenococcum geophilum 1.58]